MFLWETDCVAMDYRPIHPANGTMANAKGQRIVPAFTDEALGSLAPCFRLQALGPFSLVGEGGPVNLGSKKLCGLVAFLACAAGPQRRERLMSLLWGSHFQLQAQQNLRKALFRLRRALGADVILSNDELVWLRPGAMTCDALNFENLIGVGSHESLCEAVDQYNDLFLSNLSIREEDWNAWVTEQRNRLQALAVDALVRLGERLERLGDFPRAIEIAGRAAALNGLREDTHRMIIRSMAALGRRAEALKHYDQMAALLEHELHVQPDADTRALADDLRAVRLDEPRPAAPEPQPIDVKLVPAEEPLPAASVGAERSDPDRREEPAPRVLAHGARARAPRSDESRWRAAFGRPYARPLSILAALMVAVVFCFALVTRLPPAPTVVKRAKPSYVGRVPITVLPFARPADNAQTRLAANLIMDDLTNILPRVPNLRLKTLQGSQRFMSRPLDTSALAGELGVLYVLDGSVRAQNEKLRVNVELISQNGLRLWSDFLEREGGDQEAARDEIVKGIGRSLQIEMLKLEAARAVALRSERPEIWELLAIGWTAMFANSTSDMLAQAEAAFSEVLRRDPQMPSALIGLAAHHLSLVGASYVADSDRYLAEAEQLLDRALKRVPEASPPYYYLGILHRHRGALQPALEAFAHSTALNPSFSPGYAHKGSVLTRLGRMEEALQQIHYAMRISPKDPNFPIWTRFAGTAELESGHDGAALEWYARALALNPRSAVVHALLAGTYSLSGDAAKAQHYAAKFRQLTANLSDPQRLEMFGASSKRPEEPHRLLDGVRLALAMSQ
jgi:DNA-binding SARP family transcriptional activator/TolB-like protein/Tfp pilus assembly protein PilF